MQVKPAVAALLFIVMSVSQSVAQSLCSQRKGGELLAYHENASASYYIEVCKLPNPKGKPALSLVFTSNTADNNALRIYSLNASKPLKLDGIYVERNGAKEFILHPDNIEWANGSRTKLEAIDPKKREKLDAVLGAAFELLQWAAEYQRLPDRNSEDKYNRFLVVNFLINYELNPKP